jgi:hypothetical protein
MSLAWDWQLEKDVDQLKATLEDGSAGREAADEMRRVKEAELEEVKVRLACCGAGAPSR